MEQPLILYDAQDGVAILTLNHPERRNALSRALLEALKSYLAQIASQPEVRGVIIRASGPAFSAGHDLRELVGTGEKEAQSLFALCTDVMETIRKLPKPVIAQVHGVATAAMHLRDYGCGELADGVHPVLALRREHVCLPVAH